MTARGRRAGVSGDSREAILRAARALFAKRGFRGTTLRRIAARARVDMALVGYFFGSKAELFAAAINLPAIAGGLGELLSDGKPNLGVRVVRFYLETVFVGQNQAVAAMLRTALGDPDHVPALRELIRVSLLEGAARALGGPNAPLRAELFGALMTGLFVSRHLMRVEPLASASVEEVAASLGPSVEALLRSHPPRKTRPTKEIDS